jgi:hypothetical protein
LLTLIVVLVLLVLLASPLVAEPPVVLLLTVAFPLEALCVLELVTVTSLLLVMLVVLFQSTRIGLLGPAVLTVLSALAAAPKPLLDDVLSTVILVVVLLSLLAIPLVASPPVVLLCTRAFPVLAVCELVLVTLTLLSFRKSVRLWE